MLDTCCWTVVLSIEMHSHRPTEDIQLDQCKWSREFCELFHRCFAFAVWSLASFISPVSWFVYIDLFWNALFMVRASLGQALTFASKILGQYAWCFVTVGCLTNLKLGFLGVFVYIYQLITNQLSHLSNKRLFISQIFANKMKVWGKLNKFLFSIYYLHFELYIYFKFIIIIL